MGGKTNMRNLVILGLAVLALVACSQPATQAPAATAALPTQTAYVPTEFQRPAQGTSVVAATPTLDVAPALMFQVSPDGEPLLYLSIETAMGGAVQGTCRLNVLRMDGSEEQMAENDCAIVRQQGMLELKPREFQQGGIHEATAVWLQVRRSNGDGNWENVFDLTDVLLKTK